MVSPLADVGGLNVQILESLGRLVNYLVVELALNLVGRHDVPPQSLIDDGSRRLEDGFGHVDVSALLEDLTVNQLGDFSHGVLLGTVKLESLGGSVVVPEHLLQSLTDIDDVYWPELLLHVVGGEEVDNAGKLEEQVILETEHGSRSHDGGLGEDAADNVLSTALCSLLDLRTFPLGCSGATYLGGVELGNVVRVGVVRRDVDEPINIVLGNRLRDPLSTLNVDILIGEVPDLVSPLSPFDQDQRRRTHLVG